MEITISKQISQIIIKLNGQLKTNIKPIKGTYFKYLNTYNKKTEGSYFK
jgi:hypothetical protein